MPAKWPERKLLNYKFNEGWNACHDAFMKVIEAQPEGLIPLDEEQLSVFMASQYPNLQKDIADIIGKAWAKTICSKFAQPKREVPSVEDIDKVLYDLSHNEYGDAQSKYDLSLYKDRKEVSQAIHDLLEGA